MEKQYVLTNQEYNLLKRVTRKVLMEYNKDMLRERPSIIGEDEVTKLKDIFTL